MKHKSLALVWLAIYGVLVGLLTGCSRPLEKDPSAPPDPAAIQAQRQVPDSEKFDQLHKGKGGGKGAP